MKKLFLIGVAFMALLPSAAFARGRGVIFVGPGFAPYGWYGSPYYGMYPYGPYGFAPNAGQVKLDTHVKDADVYINGHFAGTVGQLKTMTMLAGDYDISVRAPGRSPFEEKIHVLAGKTLKLNPDLRVETPGSPTGS